MELSNLSCYPFNEDAILSFTCSPVRSKDSEWTFEEEKHFENALAVYDLNSWDLFEKIAIKVPGKTIEQIKQHFQLLVEDVNFIETWSGPLPNCRTTNTVEPESTPNSTLTSVENRQKKKGTRWTKEEHENFLLGLKKYGKGDWRSISRNSVLTKTPTQVASHAQKYFIRLAKLSTTSNPLSSAASQGKSKIEMTPPSQRVAACSSACIFYQSPTTVTSITKRT
ncbi:transcription factor SRM1-like [Coffea arabica]|uniref:Transcription factor SRM1-like n=1 Tax=Coffea arabica TaxID=13443 RepID=A0A6P6TL54_COFAR